MTYEEQHGSYPPSAFRIDQTRSTETYIGDDGATVASDVVPGSPGTSGTAAPYGMFVKLLPYMEFNHIYERLDFSLDAFNADSAQNTAFADDMIPGLLCASFSGPRTVTTAPYDTVNVAITNYKTYGATTSATLDDPKLVRASKTTKVDGARQGGGVHHPYGVASKLDAKSLTFLTVETREETLASWYDGTATAIFAIVDDDGTEKAGLNNTWSAAPTDVIHATYGGSKEMKWGPSSEHHGVTVHSFADGSVRSISDDISIDVFRSLVTRAPDDNDTIQSYLEDN